MLAEINPAKPATWYIAMLLNCRKLIFQYSCRLLPKKMGYLHFKVEILHIWAKENCLICVKLGWKNRAGMRSNVPFRPRVCQNVGSPLKNPVRVVDVFVQHLTLVVSGRRARLVFTQAGWTMASNKPAELVCTALQMAICQRRDQSCIL